MEFKKYALVGAMAAGLMHPMILSADFESNSQVDEKNMKAIREYIDAKRNISVKEKGGSLRIGGDVRFEGTKVREIRDGYVITGSKGGSAFGTAASGGSGYSYPSVSYDVEASLSFEYRKEKSYADVLLKFNHNAGLDTKNYTPNTDVAFIQDEYSDSYKPTDSKIKLAKAYFGQEIWSDGMHSVDVNVGRQRLYDLFDSRIMFFRRFDGVALKYKGSVEGIGRPHASWGTMMIADRADHYGHIGEIGMAHILDTPFSLKYAYVDLAKSGTYSDGTYGSDDGHVGNTSNTRSQLFYRHFNYKVSQLLGYFDVPAEYTWGKQTKLYAAYALNHKGKKRADFNGRRKNRAWYAGFTYGKIRAQGDYVLDLNYQWVQAESVPELDSGGLAIGLNASNQSIAYNPAAGFNNYKGFVGNLSYLATEDIMLVGKFAHTNAEDSTFAKSSAANSKGWQPATARHSFTKVELEAIYSF